MASGELFTVFKQTLQDDPTLSALLYGGIYDAQDFGREGLSMDNVPRIVEDSPLIAPFAVIRWTTSTELLRTIGAATQTVEVYVYDDQGYRTIDRAISRIIVLLNDVYLETSDRAFVHVRHSGYVSTQMAADELAYAPFQFTRFLVNQVRD